MRIVKKCLIITLKYINFIYHLIPDVSLLKEKHEATDEGVRHQTMFQQRGQLDIGANVGRKLSS